jgi:hypothetical protein
MPPMFHVVHTGCDGSQGQGAAAFLTSLRYFHVQKAEKSRLDEREQLRLYE